MGQANRSGMRASRRRPGLFDGCPGDFAGSSPEIRVERVAEWILAHAGPLLALTLRWLGPLATRKDAEDTLQELCCRLPKILRAYDPKKGEFGPYLRQSLKNLCGEAREKLQRRHAVESSSPLGEAGRGGAAGAGFHHDSEDADPSARVDLERALESILSQLPERHRTVWVLRELYGLSYDEIAAELAAPRGSVAGWLNRARARIIPAMREWLREERRD